MSNKNNAAMEPLSLVWMRRDLRLHDQAALHEACLRDGKIQPVFIFDSDILAHFPGPKDRRIGFLAMALQSLHRALQEKGGGMLVLYGRAEELIPKLVKTLKAACVICEEDYEPATIARDKAVSNALAGKAAFVQVLDHLIHPPAAIVKGDGTPYRVFTPYSKAWRAALGKHSFTERRVSLNGRHANFDAIAQMVDADAEFCRVDASATLEEMVERIGYKLTDMGEWDVDSIDKRLEDFITYRLANYKAARDMLAEDGTSKLSPYLRFGLVSVRECVRLATLNPGLGSDTWINELIWREFYAMILYRFPEVVEWEFQEQYRGTIAWKQDEKLLRAFIHGETGYPIVDAAMRQLVKTGWMHNRARMVVASFMTKDLHLDWRLGEKHFAQYLMDYELASNNGGWQWAASTGTDAQPYFRIFNPELQSRKFDPEGKYIRQWVPELREMKAPQIHAPHQNTDLFLLADYPSPIVDHMKAKEEAIQLFKFEKAAS